MRPSRGPAPRPARCSCSPISTSRTSTPSSSATRLRRTVPVPGRQLCWKEIGPSMRDGNSIARPRFGSAALTFTSVPRRSHRIDVMRSWHTESNLTDYTPLFAGPQGGRVDCGNLVNMTYTSHIHGSATLQFYPLAQGQNPPQTASVVLPMAADSTGGTVTLNTPSDQLAGTFTMPTNVERAYLDVFAQSQSGDEFWYTCAPDDVAGELENCGSSAFREAEVSYRRSGRGSRAHLSVDLHRRNRSLSVASDSRRTHPELRTVSRGSHAVCRAC